MICAAAGFCGRTELRLLAAHGLTKEKPGGQAGLCLSGACYRPTGFFQSIFGRVMMLDRPEVPVVDDGPGQQDADAAG